MRPRPRSNVPDAARSQPGDRTIIGALGQGIELGLLVPDGDGFLVSSPRLLELGRELHAAGVPLPAVLTQLRALRQDMDHVATRFMDMAQLHLWESYVVGSVRQGPAALTTLVTRLRTWAQTAVDLEFTRAMQAVATRTLEKALEIMMPADAKPARRTRRS